MGLTSGSRLGAYETLALLGSGGMGKVFRAKDTKLGRDVALKIRPEAASNDPDRIARFQREAELLATPNHPNIAAVYGVEESSGKRLEPYRAVFGPIDNVKVAESCGADGLRTTNLDGLASAARRAVDRRRSLVIAVPVSYADDRRRF